MKDVFRRAITQPIKDGDEKGLSLLRAMMAHFALRRSKNMVSLELPSKTVEIRSVEFPPNCEHKAVYDTIFESARAALTASIQEGDMQSLSHASIFEILTRLRQACCSGKMVPAERLERAEEVLALIKSKEGVQLTIEEGKELLMKLKGALEDADATDCAVCFEPLTETTGMILRGCRHVFCRTCLNIVVSTKNVFGDNANHCPFCRRGFTEKDMIEMTAAQAASEEGKSEENALSQRLADLGPSPKMAALMTAIKQMLPGERGVVFSQFTQFLNIVEDVLRANNFSFLRIDGKRNAVQRKQDIAEFSKDDGGPDFMLCSLQAAGVGINLTRANHIFMMDT